MTEPCALICVICKNPCDLPYLTSDGHVCMVHIRFPCDDLEAVYRFDRMPPPKPLDPDAKPAPAPKRYELALTMAELLAVKDALIVARSMGQEVQCRGDKGQRLGRGYIDAGSSLVSKINVMLMEEAGIVVL